MYLVSLIYNANENNEIKFSTHISASTKYAYIDALPWIFVLENPNGQTCDLCLVMLL